MLCMELENSTSKEMKLDNIPPSKRHSDDEALVESLDNKIPSDLFNAVKFCCWQSALSILDIKKNHHQVRYIGSRGSTVLHWACNNATRNVEGVVLMILNLWPQAAKIRNRRNELPLHLAISKYYSLRLSDDFIVTLLNAFPHAATHVLGGSRNSPLFLSIMHQRSVKVVESILLADTSMISYRNVHGATPLRLFFALYNKKLRLAFHHNKYMDSHFIVYLHKITTALMEAQHNVVTAEFKVSNSNEWSILHFAVKMRSCPWSFTRLLYLKQPELALLPDANGNLPIHTLLHRREHSYDYELYSCADCKNQIKGAWYHSIRSFHIVCTRCAKKHDDQYLQKFARLEPVQKEPDLIREMLSSFPKYALISDGEGRSVLTLSIISNDFSNDEIIDIAMANPAAVTTRDLKTHMCPFMIASCSNMSLSICQPKFDEGTAKLGHNHINRKKKYLESRGSRKVSKQRKNDRLVHLEKAYRLLNMNPQAILHYQ